MNEILSVHEIFLCINLQTLINHYNIHYAIEHDKAKKCNGFYSFVNYIYICALLILNNSNTLHALQSEAINSVNDDNVYMFEDINCSQFSIFAVSMYHRCTFRISSFLHLLNITNLHYYILLT